MTAYAIMAATPEGRIAKLREFDSEVEADAHIASFIGEFPSAFFHAGVAAPLAHWLIDMAAQTIVIDVLPPHDFGAEDQATIDALLLNSGIMRALAKALFLVVNDVRVLKGQNTFTASQFKTFLKGLIR